MSVRVEADKGSTAPVSVSAIAKLYGPKDAQQRISSPAQVVQPGGSAVIRWTLPDTEGQPIFAAGIELTPAAGLERASAQAGTQAGTQARAASSTSTIWAGPALREQRSRSPSGAESFGGAPG